MCEKDHVIGLMLTKSGPALDLFRACHLTHILLVARTVVPFSSAPRTIYVHSDDAPLLIIVRSEEKLSPRSFASLSILPSNCSTPSKASFFSPLFYRCGACTSSLVEELGSSNIEIPANMGRTTQLLYPAADLQLK